MGRKLKKLKFLPNYAQFSGGIIELIQMYVWYSSRFKAIGVGSLADGKSQISKKVFTQFDRDVLAIIDRANILVFEAITRLNDQRTIVLLCNRWIDWLVPKYWQIRKGSFTEKKLSAEIAKLLNFHTGNPDMYPPKSTESAKDTRSKDGRPKPMLRISEDKSIEFAQSIFCVSSNFIAENGGPQKTAQLQVANYLVLSERTVRRYRRDFVCGEKALARYSAPQFPKATFWSMVDKMSSDYSRAIVQRKRS